MLKKINKKLLVAVLFVCISAIVYSCKGTDEHDGSDAGDIVFLEEAASVASEDTVADENFSANGEVTAEKDEAISAKDGMSSANADANEAVGSEKSVTSRKSQEDALTRTMQEDSEENMQASQQIVVYVCGKVNHPGVYTLDVTARMIDAVNAAGGMTEDAGTDYLNLADWIADGDRIYVPSKDEAAEWAKQNPLNAGDSLEQRQTSVGQNSKNNQTDNSGNALASSDLVNINTADKTQLMTLPGIGEAKAESIIKYRENHGMFQSIEALKNVSGIKTGVYEGLKDFITVDE